MTHEFKAGQLAAHKTRPDRPWVVRRFDKEVAVYCASVSAEGEPVFATFWPCELEPYAFAFDDRFHALIAAAESHGDEAVRERVTVLLRQAWNLYVDLTGGEGATDE